MALQKFPVAAVQKIRQYIRTYLTLPAGEQHPEKALSNLDLEDLPEPDSLTALGDLFRLGSFEDHDIPAPNTNGQWFISTANPTLLVSKLPGLKFRPDYRLVTFLYRQGKNGVGATWAVPEQFSNTAVLEHAIATAGDHNHPPQPQGALDHFMAAVEGNFSPQSLLAAAILQRELTEFGRVGSLGQWQYHRFIAGVPPQRQWQWQGKQPQNFAPKVQLLPEQRAAVEFFTCRVVAPISIVRHVAQYSTQSYQPIRWVDQTLAVSP